MIEFLKVLVDSNETIEAEKGAGLLKQVGPQMPVGASTEGPVDQAACRLVTPVRAWPGGGEEGVWASESLRPGFES